MVTIRIFDTTLRDGEQTPGVNLNVREKVEIAKEIAAIGVDAIEAGFPNSSQGDFSAVLAVARELKGVQVAGLCRAVTGDVQRAWEALRFAEAPLINIVIASSERHMMHKLRMTEHEVVERAVSAIKIAKSYCHDVEFTAEDASRSDKQFLCRLLQKAIAAGATIVNIPDTVGYTTPQEYAALVQYVLNNVSNIEKACLSVHCHNDLGMATANTLSGLTAGARQAEVTVNGLGERAGNASLEEVVMALSTRRNYYNLEHKINTHGIYKLSQLISKYTGMEIAPGKPIVGDNAFRHQSGIHQHGVLTDRETYEIMSAESIGRYQVDSLVLGKLSGRHAFSERLHDLGFHLSPEEVKAAFEQFKVLADRKKDVTVRDIAAILEGRLHDVKPVVELANYQILSANNMNSTATVCLTRGGETLQKAAIAGGPVDAAFKAIDEILGLNLSLESYVIKAVTEGADALGEVTVRVKYGDGVYLGKNVSTDIIKSSIMAYINAINRIYGEMLLN